MPCIVRGVTQTEAPAPGPDARISRAVSVLLEDLDMSVDQAAASTGLSRASIYRKLAGDSPWKASEVEVLARFFRVQPGDLFSGETLVGRRAGIS